MRASMRQSRQVTSLTYAWSKPSRSALARVSVMYAPEEVIQWGPSPVWSLRLKSSEKSRPEGGGVPPSGTPPSGGGAGGGGGAAPGAGALPKINAAFPELL